MSTYTINSHKVQQAVKELEAVFIQQRNALVRKGLTFSITDAPMDSFAEVLEGYHRKHIVISAVGSSTSIYEQEANLSFRFVHDCTHGRLGKDFSLQGEEDVIMDQFMSMDVSDLANRIFLADTLGQVQYYYQHGKFVDDQATFIMLCLNEGIQTAIDTY